MKNIVVCATCGTYYPKNTNPEVCTICNEDRQYIPESGQQWTTAQQLHERYSIKVTKRKEKLYQLEVNPVFAIGQRALLVLSEKGNVLWDCIPLLDEATIEFIKSKGGIKAIAFSHPHYYSNMREWAEVFQCPVYIHENDKAHVVDSNQWTTFWSGDEFMLWDGIQIILVGGHFEGSSILRVPFLSAQGTILCGDTLFLSPNKRHFSILRSYPNRIPLPLAEMKRIETRLNDIPFDAFYGYISSQTLEKNVKTVLKESFAKYV